MSGLRPLRELSKAPVVDVGTLARIKRGDVFVGFDTRQPDRLLRTIGEQARQVAITVRDMRAICA